MTLINIRLLIRTVSSRVTNPGGGNLLAFDEGYNDSVKITPAISLMISLLSFEVIMTKKQIPSFQISVRVRLVLFYL